MFLVWPELEKALVETNYRRTRRMSFLCVACMEKGCVGGRKGLSLGAGIGSRLEWSKKKNFMPTISIRAKFLQ
jgi:hypothetical protein